MLTMTRHAIPTLGVREPPLMHGSSLPVNGRWIAFKDTPMANAEQPARRHHPVDQRRNPAPVSGSLPRPMKTRFFNLSFYKGVDAAGVNCDAANDNPSAESTGVACTEVLLNPAEDDGCPGRPVLGVFPTNRWRERTVLTGSTIGTDAWRHHFRLNVYVVARLRDHLDRRPDRVQCGKRRSALDVDHSRPNGMTSSSTSSQYASQTRILYNDAPSRLPGSRPALRRLHRQPGFEGLGTAHRQRCP